MPQYKFGKEVGQINNTLYVEESLIDLKHQSM